MASNIKNYMKGKRTVHSVGSVTSYNPPTLFHNGATVVEDEGVDNFCLVELGFNSTSNEPEVRYATASATATNVYVTVTPESVLEEYGEKLSDFYNEKGELATIAYLPSGFTFETSNVTAVDELKVGAFVVWDSATMAFAKKANSTDGSNVPEDKDIKVFQVIGIETAEKYTIDGMTLVELVVVR